MSDEPSYQYRGPTKQVVYTYILHMIHSSVEWNKLIQMNQRLPYRILDIGNISLIIKECIEERAKGYESLKWFWTSTRYCISGMVVIKIREYYRKKAITILKNSFIIDNWINHILYGPGGIRYKIHKTSYQKLAGDYKVSNAI
jgi:hypothetical protein|tara:strand:+ start:161 stop:589 length:429 start_codon:yes stop_codon:yes gene_type:complete